MTHAELLARCKPSPSTRGLDPDIAACAGPVFEVFTRPDQVMSAAGVVLNRFITVWRCTLCFANIIVDDRDTILNHYPSVPVEIRAVVSGPDAR
jgi:hypothetical protein